MNKNIEKLSESARNNAEFLSDIFIADKDTPPNINNADTNPIVEGTFISCNYEWLVGKYGKDWEKNI